MSAYVVGHAHIDALLSYALQNEWPVSYTLPITGNQIEITSDNVTEVGRILLTENERSVQHRYPGEAPDDLPGVTGERASTYQFQPWATRLEPLGVLNGCNCFDYQANETDDYRQSVACVIVDAIRHRAITRLPGMDKAPGWEFRR